VGSNSNSPQFNIFSKFSLKSNFKTWKVGLKPNQICCVSFKNIIFSKKLGWHFCLHFSHFSSCRKGCIHNLEVGVAFHPFGLLKIIFIFKLTTFHNLDGRFYHLIE
jgi:hypothetical protein